MPDLDAPFDPGNPAHYPVLVVHQSSSDKQIEMISEKLSVNWVRVVRDRNCPPGRGYVLLKPARRVPAPPIPDLDLGPIKARLAAWPDNEGAMYALVMSDVPALVAEVERLQAENRLLRRPGG